MSKSLSNGTLSLRFMQNALRRQQLQEVELERAEIKDEGKWEVGQDVKEAWGIGEGTLPSASAVYESSYLPFLFSYERGEDSMNHTSKPLGRRMFNKKGLDVSQGQSQSQPQQDTNNNGHTPDGGESELAADGNDDLQDGTRMMQSKGRKSRVHANPMPISSNSLGSRSLKGFDTLDLPNEESRGSKSARDAIFSLSGVGIDLRTAKKPLEDDGLTKYEDQKPKQNHQGAPSSTGFVKPAGVVEPAPRTVASTTVSKAKAPKLTLPDVIDGARKKRPRDLNEPVDEGKVRKKKKRSTPSKSGTDA